MSNEQNPISAADVMSEAIDVQHQDGPDALPERFAVRRRRRSAHRPDHRRARPTKAGLWCSATPTAPAASSRRARRPAPPDDYPPLREPLERGLDVGAHEPPVPAELDRGQQAAARVVLDGRALHLQQLGELRGRHQLGQQRLAHNDRPMSRSARARRRSARRSWDRVVPRRSWPARKAPVGRHGGARPVRRRRVVVHCVAPRLRRARSASEPPSPAARRFPSSRPHRCRSAIDVTGLRAKRRREPIQRRALVLAHGRVLGAHVELVARRRRGGSPRGRGSSPCRPTRDRPSDASTKAGRRSCPGRRGR